VTGFISEALSVEGRGRELFELVAMVSGNQTPRRWKAPFRSMRPSPAHLSATSWSRRARGSVSPSADRRARRRQVGAPTRLARRDETAVNAQPSTVALAIQVEAEFDVRVASGQVVTVIGVTWSSLRPSSAYCAHRVRLQPSASQLLGPPFAEDYGGFGGGPIEQM